MNICLLCIVSFYAMFSLGTVEKKVRYNNYYKKLKNNNNDHF